MIAKNEEAKATANVLKGMDAIERFSGFNRVILMRWKREYPLMPMTKPGGIYLADPDKLRQFLKDVAAGETEKYLSPGPGAEMELGHAGDGDPGNDQEAGAGGGKGKKDILGVGK